MVAEYVPAVAPAIKLPFLYQAKVGLNAFEVAVKVTVVPAQTAADELLVIVAVGRGFTVTVKVLVYPVGEPKMCAR